MPTVTSPSSTGPISPVKPGNMGVPDAGTPGPARSERAADPAVPQLAVLGRSRKPRRARSRLLGARQALSFAMGIASIFDLTGTMAYRSMRSVLPPAPPRADEDSDPFRAAMGTILSAHRDAMASADDDPGPDLRA